ncbi:MAG: AraC family transcriptional regulator [Verrucomicrobiota bacterium]
MKKTSSPGPAKQLSFGLWSDLHCRLFWGYRGRVSPVYRNATYNVWPGAAWYVLKGSVEMEGEDRRETARAGQWILPGGEPRRQRFVPEAEIISLRFLISWQAGTSLFQHRRARVFQGRRFPRLQATAESLIELMEVKLGGPGPENQLGLTRETVETHFSVMHRFYHWAYEYVHTMLALGMVPEAPEEFDPRVESALAWLRERPLSEGWSEAELARMCGLSVSQLNRLFVRYLGQTPVAVYEKRRLEAATMALELTDQDIKAIAYDLGFSSPGHFCTWFKRKSGQTPSAHRRASLHRQRA